MNEDIAKLGTEYESLVRESAQLDNAINHAFDELLELFIDHYPILQKVPILELSVEELVIWMKSRTGNPMV